MVSRARPGVSNRHPEALDIKYGVATEKDMLDILDQLHAELVPVRGFVPLPGLMIARWARKPEIGRDFR
jgi:hypothetical protein